MAIDAHSTTAPAVQSGLLRVGGAPCRVLGKSPTVSNLPPSILGAVPVPTPALTAETVAMLDVIPVDVPHGGAPMCSAADLPRGVASDVRHGGAGEVCATVAQTAVADLAQALHARRALEGALDHGTALLAALGLPMLVEPGFVPLDPATIGDAVDTAIATLDALDAPGVDLEPSLGWIDGKPSLSDSHDDREAEDDDEPMLGAPERHPAWDPWSSGRNSTGRQTHWSDGRNGSANDGEAEAGYDLPEGDDERCGSSDVDLEPWLGAPENHDRAPDQEHWAEGGYFHCSDVEIGEEESQTDKGLPFDARQANEAAAREAGRQAEAMRRRKDRRTTGVRDPDEVQLGNLRMIDGGTVREMWAAHG